METLLQTDSHIVKPRTNILYLDVIRIFAIYFVLLLHALNPWLSMQSMYGTPIWFLCMIISPLDRIGVPLFFMLSGYLILSDPRTLDAASFYKRRLPRILTPFFLWSFLYYAIENRLAFSFWGYLSSLLNQTGKYHLWYVYTLVGMYMLAPFFKRMVDNCTKKQILLLFFLILFPSTIIPFIRALFHIGIYGFSTMIEGYFGFFLFGYLLAKWPPERKHRFVMYAFGLMAWLGSALGNILSSSADQISLPFNSGYNIVHYMTSGAFFVFVQALSPILEKRLPPAPTRYWAGITYGIYLCHVLVLEVWTGFVKPESIALNIFGSFFATAVFSTLIMLILGRINSARKLLL